MDNYFISFTIQYLFIAVKLIIA